MSSGGSLQRDIEICIGQVWTLFRQLARPLLTNLRISLGGRIMRHASCLELVHGTLFTSATSSAPSYLLNEPAPTHCLAGEAQTEGACYG